MKALLILIFVVVFAETSPSSPIYSVTNFPEFMGGFFDEIGEEGDFLILSLCKQGDYWEEVVLYLEIYYYHLTLRYPDPAMATHSAIVNAWKRFGNLFSPCTTDELPVFQMVLDAISHATVDSVYAEFFEDPSTNIDIINLLVTAVFSLQNRKVGEYLGIIFRRLFFGLQEGSIHF
eukprot:TRINITY_DN188_c0_g1_i1.p1 TRINITY_DN188_c0_g1~~TRINITY_DN188_c0_g1_i1.p1  ORF type:complete len:176 (-),score=4.79 TRINITY_DN188_c0_g1_i1:82-609(-)